MQICKFLHNIPLRLYHIYKCDSVMNWCRREVDLTLLNNLAIGITILIIGLIHNHDVHFRR